MYDEGKMLKSILNSIVLFSLLAASVFCEHLSYPTSQAVHFIVTQETILAEAQALFLSVDFDLEFLTPVPKVNSFSAYAMLSNISINGERLPFTRPLVFEIEDKYKIKETSGQLEEYQLNCAFNEKFFERFFAQLMAPLGEEIAVGSIYPVHFIGLLHDPILEDSSQIQIKKQKKGWYFGEVSGELQTENCSVEVEGKARWKEENFLIQERKINYFIKKNRGEGPSYLVFKETWFSI